MTIALTLGQLWWIVAVCVGLLIAIAFWPFRLPKANPFGIEQGEPWCRQHSRPYRECTHAKESL